MNRPNRVTRRARGKSDPIDAEAAARAALAGVATAVPKSHSGLVEAIRVIFVARRGAVQARTAAINTLHQMIITAPMRLRDQLQPLTRRHQITTCARFHAKDLTDPARATRLALRRLARRIDHLTTEIDDAEHDLTELVAELAPQLLAEPGVGPLSAAQLLITAGDNPDRMTSPAGFAALCGTTPSRSPPAKPTGTGSTAAGTGRPTARCTPSSTAGSATTPKPRPTPTNAPPKTKPNSTSAAASSATSPAASSHSSSTPTRPPKILPAAA